MLGGVLTSFNTIIVPYLSKFVKRFEKIVHETLKFPLFYKGFAECGRAAWRGVSRAFFVGDKTVRFSRCGAVRWTISLRACLTE